MAEWWGCGERVHVYPFDDVVEHELEGDGCVCVPSIKMVVADDGFGGTLTGWLIIHHSLDGRENRE